MPIYDYRCNTCGKVRKDVFQKSWEENETCECEASMKKIPCRFVADVFPSDGIFLEHVSANGKRFHSKKEMQKYAKDHDLELGALG